MCVCLSLARAWLPLVLMEEAVCVLTGSSAWDGAPSTTVGRVLCSKGVVRPQSLQAQRCLAYPSCPNPT